MFFLALTQIWSKACSSLISKPNSVFETRSPFGSWYQVCIGRDVNEDTFDSYWEKIPLIIADKMYEEGNARINSS